MKSTAKRLYDAGMRCNCDLDNWVHERSTGHSWVCRIHKAAQSLKPNEDFILSPNRKEIQARIERAK